MADLRAESLVRSSEQPSEKPDNKRALPDGQGPRDGLDRAIVSIGHGLSILFLVSAVIIVWEIVARYVFNSPTFWVHETTTLICALLFAYGGAYCVAEDRHIRIVFLYDAVGPAARRRLDTLISFLCILYASGLTWAGWQVVNKSIYTPQGNLRLETSGSAWDPPFPAYTKIFLFLVLAAMLLQFCLRFVAQLRGRRDD